ncbi:MAG: cation diffusion facilitator family transporter [Deltaproteobacteria bacterium]
MRRELRAIQVAIACSIIGVTTKMIVGFVTGSMSMISSAVDSFGDLFVSIVNLFVVRMSGRGPDDEHNYGHAKIEGLGAMFEGGFIFAAGLFIIYEAVHKMIVGEVSHDSTLGIVTMLPILALTFATVMYLRKVATETGSLVVKSDAVHYMTDVWVNVGVLVSLVLVKLTHRPIIDSIISVIIALYMLYSSTHILGLGFGVVMDRSLDKDTVKKLTALLSACAKIESFHDFRTRAGKIPHVDFHIVVRPETTTLEVHDLFLELSAQVREIVGPSTKLLLHADPVSVTPVTPKTAGD